MIFTLKRGKIKCGEKETSFEIKAEAETELKEVLIKEIEKKLK